MNNKRGFLLGEETLKMVVAVICIGILIYLLVAVYFNVTGEQKMKEADASMNEKIIPELEKLNTGEITASEVHVPNPAGWIILNFVSAEEKPNSCIGLDCICICEEVFPDLFNWQINRCDKKGICVNVDGIDKFEKIKIGKAGTNLLIQKVNGRLQISK